MKVGVIGLGSMGQNHARILSGMGILEGVADISHSLAKSVGKRFSVPYYASHRDMLQHDFDAIVIVTPTSTHRKVSLDAIKLEKHLLLEKPMTGSSRSLKGLIVEADRRGVVLAGGFTERHNPAVEFAKRSMQSKVYGKLIAATTRRVSSMPSRVRDVGVIMDLGIHDIDVVQYIVANSPKSVYALGGASGNARFEDHANILIEFEGGETGFVEVNWLTPMKVRKLALTCSDNFVEVDYMDQSAVVCSSSFKISGPNDLYNVPIEFDMRKIALKKDEPLKREICDFLESIDHERPPLVAGETAITTLMIAESALRSIRSGKKQNIV